MLLAFLVSLVPIIIVVIVSGSISFFNEKELNLFYVKEDGDEELRYRVQDSAEVEEPDLPENEYSEEQMEAEIENVKSKYEDGGEPEPEQNPVPSGANKYGRTTNQQRPGMRNNFGSDSLESMQQRVVNAGGAAAGKQQTVRGAYGNGAPAGGSPYGPVAGGSPYGSPAGNSPYGGSAGGSAGNPYGRMPAGGGQYGRMQTGGNSYGGSPVSGPYGGAGSSPKGAPYGGATPTAPRGGPYGGSPVGGPYGGAAPPGSPYGKKPASGSSPLDTGSTSPTGSNVPHGVGGIQGRKGSSRAGNKLDLNSLASPEMQSEAEEVLRRIKRSG